MNVKILLTGFPVSKPPFKDPARLVKFLPLVQEIPWVQRTVTPTLMPMPGIRTETIMPPPLTVGGGGALIRSINIVGEKNYQ